MQFRQGFKLETMLASSLILKLGRWPLGFCRASVNVQLPGWGQLFCSCFALCTVAEIRFGPIPPFPAAKYWQGFNVPLSIQNYRAWVVATPRVVMVTPRACLRLPTDFTGTFSTLIYRRRVKCFMLWSLSKIFHCVWCSRNIFVKWAQTSDRCHNNSRWLQKSLN